MGSSKSAPDVPDLGTTIGAGVGGNWNMARAINRGLPGTSSPYGTSDFIKDRNAKGKVIKATYIDPYTGKKYKAPTWEEKIKLSPGEQQKYDLSTQAQIAALGQANKLIGSMGDFGLKDFNFAKSLNEIGGNIYDPKADPLTLGNEATEKRLYELGSKRLDPRFAREAATQEAALMARGIRPGTAAYSAAGRDRFEKENDAYTRLMLEGRGQAASEQQAEWESRLRGQGQQYTQAMGNRARELAERGQYAGEQFGVQDRNISYLSQLLGLGQPNMPQFTGAQAEKPPYFDYPGAINQNWDQQMKSWEAEMAQKGNMAGGAMSAIGSFAPLLMSDERIKDNVKQVGTTQDGLPIYEFSIGDGEMQTGVMAQDVEKVDPSAVVQDPGTGIKGVNYDQAVGDGTGTYTVEEGDNIWTIGERLGVDPQTIIAANPDLENPDFIVPGQQLLVPGMAAPGPEAIPMSSGTVMGGGPQAVTQALLPGSSAAQLTSDVASAGGVAPGLAQPTYPGGAGGARPDPTQLDPEMLRQMLMRGGMGGY